MSISSNIEILKRDRLRVHFAEVENLANAWVAQLHAEEPFPALDTDIWPLRYKPSLEADSDNNHMLRRHIKSRALWKHHGEWELTLGRVDGLGEMLATDAVTKTEGLGQDSPDLKFTKMFARTALEVAFVQTMGRTSSRKFEPNQVQGVILGGILIESAASTDSRGDVKDAHDQLIGYLMDHPDLKEIAGHWNDLRGTEFKMKRIVEVILKSGDIFYPCRFCRKLF